MSKLDDLVSIEQAAKRVHMRPETLRQLCLDHRIAIEWGGGPKVKRLKVKLSEAEAMLLSRRAGRHRQERKRRAIVASARLHPDVRC